MEKKKMKSNSEDDYNKALASADPTIISKEELEKMTKEAMKKFKSLWVSSGLLLESFC